MKSKAGVRDMLNTRAHVQIHHGDRIGPDWKIQGHPIGAFALHIGYLSEYARCRRTAGLPTDGLLKKGAKIYTVKAHLGNTPMSPQA